MLSRSGEASDPVATSSERFSPEADTTAMWARPLPRMTFSRSEKSTRTREYSTVMSSAMPLVAMPSTSSALPKASRIGSLPYMSLSFSLSIISSESTHLCSSVIPSNA